MRFTKMHGAGNDYVYVDGFQDELPIDPATVAIQISDRHKGIGADGLILICPSDEADAEMKMYNADGSLSEMCGNGIRCVAKYLFDRQIVGDKLTVATGDGLKTLEVLSEYGRAHRVRVDMGEPQLVPSKIPTTLSTTKHGHVIDAPFSIEGHLLEVTCVSMGNPHCVIFIDEPDTSSPFASDMWVEGLGPKIEVDDRFPARVNVEFVRVASSNEAYQRTWERGSGETLACGTGASAVCVAGALTGRTERLLTVHLKGGTLELEWDEMSNHVFMTGPAEEVFRGEIDLSFET